MYALLTLHQYKHSGWIVKIGFVGNHPPTLWTAYLNDRARRQITTEKKPVALPMTIVVLVDFRLLVIAHQ